MYDQKHAQSILSLLLTYNIILQCNRTIAFNALFNQMLLGPTKVALIGSGCSVATEPTAEVSQYYNLTQVSPAG